jgi:hypothetical protein
MSLVDELKALDVSAIVHARAGITASVSGGDFKLLVDGGEAMAALGQLGDALKKVRDAVEHDPAALLQPLADALGALAGGLVPQDLPVDEYLAAVREGAGLIARALEGLGDPAQLGKGLGLGLGEALEKAAAVAENFTSLGGEDAAHLGRLIAVVDRGMPVEPGALATLALDMLLPFPHASLGEVRAALSQLLLGAAAPALPGGRCDGLVLAFRAVEKAGNSGDAAAVQAALRDLTRVHASTLASLGDDMTQLLMQLRTLATSPAIDAIRRGADALEAGGTGLLEYLDQLMQMIRVARATVESVDLGPLLAVVPEGLDRLEQALRAMFLDPVDQLVAELTRDVRDFFARLPLRELRARLGALIHRVAQALGDADLGRHGREAHALVAQLTALISAPNLAGDIKAAVAKAEQTIQGVLDQIQGALDTVKNAIDGPGGLASRAQAILGKAADAIDQFAAAVKQLQQQFDVSIVSGAADQVIAAIHELREQAEDLLSKASLPEPLRPLIDQLIGQLEAIDVARLVGDPLKQATAKLALPAPVEAAIQSALAEAAKIVENLIPQSLIGAIQAETKAALDAVAAFDPRALLGGVSRQLGEVAAMLDKLALPKEVIEPLRAPYLLVAGALDQVRPSKLLQPILHAYDELLGNLPIPSPRDGTTKVMDHLDGAYRALSRTVTQPMNRLAPAGTQTDGTAPAPAPPPAPPASVRLGDLARLLGYLPAKLREVLAALPAGPAGEATRAIDAVVGGLARDLRGVEAALWAIERRLDDGLDALLAPVGDAQLDAQLALQAHFSAGGLDLDPALDTCAAAGPGGITRGLQDASSALRGGAHDAARAAVGALAGALERLATTLERSPLAGLTGDVQRLLERLDVEPLAAELDAFGAAVIAKAPALFDAHKAELMAAANRFTDLLQLVSPGTLVKRFIPILHVVQEELQVLDPRRLAAELDEPHAVLVEALAEYDPARLAAELAGAFKPVADALRALDPAALLGDLTGFDALIARARDADPAKALAGVGASLRDVGDRLVALDPASLLDFTSGLRAQIDGEADRALEAIRQELVTLLGSLHFFGGSVSASVSVEGHT